VLGTHDAQQLLLALNRLVVELGADVETIAPLDADVQAVYRYLVSAGGGLS